MIFPIDQQGNIRSKQPSTEWNWSALETGLCLPHPTFTPRAVAILIRFWCDDEIKRNSWRTY